MQPQLLVKDITSLGRLYSRRQLANLLGIHPGSVARYERAGLLRAIKINTRVTRYAEAEVQRFIQEARVR